MSRILLVEDEPNIAEIIRFKLTREGHEVTGVETLGEMRERLAGLAPDLILLDASLPGEDPLGWLAESREGHLVVILTELHDEATPRRAAQAGAAATVGKPFKPTQLARLVAELVGGPAPVG